MENLVESVEGVDVVVAPVVVAPVVKKTEAEEIKEARKVLAEKSKAIKMVGTLQQARKYRELLQNNLACLLEYGADITEFLVVPEPVKKAKAVKEPKETAAAVVA